MQEFLHLIHLCPSHFSNFLPRMVSVLETDVISRHLPEFPLGEYFPTLSKKCRTQNSESVVKIQNVYFVKLGFPVICLHFHLTNIFFHLKKVEDEKF